MSSIPEFAPTLHRLVVTHIEHSVLISPTAFTSKRFSSNLGLGGGIGSPEERRTRAMQEAMETYISVAPKWLVKELVKRDDQSVMSFSHRSPEQLKELHERFVHSRAF
ncbi:hypothetical protein DL93DRAFT_2069930 [Clavulina sp. PMI_390]|nr:hypothetical protein DL93DRAFT_2069930 [Clavulina sp. PMI_390]